MKKLLVSVLGLVSILAGLILNSSLVTPVQANAAVAQTNAGSVEYQMMKELALFNAPAFGACFLIFGTILVISGFASQSKKKV